MIVGPCEYGQTIDYCGKMTRVASKCVRCGLVPEIAEALAAIRAAEREACARIAEARFPRGRAHTYASENADRYIALEDAAEVIAAAIRARKGEK